MIEYNREVCRYSSLDESSYYAIPICKLGHGWSSDCMKGNFCPEGKPARIPTLEELKEEFGKPRN